jgi:hypothetical protein
VNLIKLPSTTVKFITIFLCTLAIIFKLYLTRKYEIIAESSDPENYIYRAANNIWFSDKIGMGTLGHPPGYSIFILLSSLSGIPLRICHEIFYIFSAALLIYCIQLLKISRLVCLLVFFLLIFYPLTFRFFNDARSEAIVVSFLNILVAFLILMLIAKTRKGKIIYSCLSGLMLGIISVTRPEKEIIYLYLLGLSIFVWFSSNTNIIIDKLKKIAYICLIPLLIFWFVNFSFSLLNYTFLGVPAVTFLESASFKGAYTKLMKINVRTPQHYIPITQAQFKAAYQVSPTFKTFKSFLPKPEISGEYTVWELIYAARKSINDNQPKKIYQVFTKVDKELGLAFKDKLLPSKPYVFGYLDPNFEVWLPHLSQSFSKVVMKFLFPPMSEVEKIVSTDDPKASASLFNLVANRRAALIGKVNPTSKIFLKIKIVTYLLYAVNIAGVISFALLLFYSFIYKAKSRLLSTYIIVVFSILLTHVGRLLLYTLVDVTSWIIPMRYLFPIMPLFSGLSLLNVFVVFNLFSKKIQNTANEVCALEPDALIENVFDEEDS